MKPPARISAWIAPERHRFVRILRCVKLGAGGAVMFRAGPGTAARLLKFGATEQIAHKLPYQRHAGLPTHEDHLVKVFGFEFGVGERAQAMRARARDDVAGEVFQFGAAEPATEAEGGSEKRE